MSEAMSETIDQILSSPLVTTTLLGLGIALVGVWIAATWWAYQDATRRSEAEFPRWLAAAWILLSTPLLLPLSLLVYTLLRPQEAAADRRTRELVATLQGMDHQDPRCPACAETIDATWARCPSCALWLARPCDRCERLAPVDARICPWCAWELVDEPASPVDKGVAAAAGRVPQPLFEPVPRPSGAPGVEVGGVAAAMAGLRTSSLAADVATLADTIPAQRPSPGARRGRHERAPGHDRSREDETVRWAGGPVEVG
jgi:hypothetical protein